MSKERERVGTTGRLKGETSLHPAGPHSHPQQLTLVRLLWASSINVGFALVECVGGILANSLALISDAVHNLADAASTVIAYVAGRAAQRPATAKYTFGYRRFEILAALCNAIILFVIYGLIFMKAFGRFHGHMDINSRTVLLISGVGMTAKFIAMQVLRRPAHGNLNARAAYMHLLADLLSSFAVILGGIAIHLWHTSWVDSLVTLCVGSYLLFNTWPILRECIEILMQAAPAGGNLSAITNRIESYAEIKTVRDVHYWQLAENDTFFSARITLRATLPQGRATSLMAEVENVVKDDFNVQHVLLALDTPPTQAQKDETHGIA